MPALREGLPALRDGLPALREGLPASREGLSALREGPPALREGLPALRDGSVISASNYSTRNTSVIPTATMTMHHEVVKTFNTTQWK